MSWKRIALSTALVASIAALPLSRAEAHRGGWPFFWPFAAATAIVGTAAAIATAPVRAIAAAPYYYGPPPAPYYAPPPAYYPPRYYNGGYGGPAYYSPY
jgi:hypothetical protein